MHLATLKHLSQGKGKAAPVLN